MTAGATFEAGRYGSRRSGLWDLISGWAATAARSHGAPHDVGDHIPAHDHGWVMMSGRGRGHRHGWGRWGAHFGSWGPGDFSGAVFGRGRKVGRGDVRSAILGLLAEEPMHGYQIIQELTERSGGMWRPSPGSVYPTLQQLEDEGLVRAGESHGRRVFHLTDSGRAEAARRAEAGAPPWAMWDEGSPLADLREVGIGVAAAVVQVAQAGSDDQIVRAREILLDTRKRLYGLLAEDGPTDSS
jgi:DNA-binding PadR family transcriptional regulator